MTRRQLLPTIAVVVYAIVVYRQRPLTPVGRQLEEDVGDEYRQLFDQTFRLQDGMRRLSLQTVIWPRNWVRLMDCATPLPEGYGTETETIYPGSYMRSSLTTCKGYIFVPSTSSRNKNNVDNFVRHVLPHLNDTFVLITADGDNAYPSRVRRPKSAMLLLEHPLLLRWYTQNYDGTIRHPKLFAIPIGLDLHTRRDGVRWDTAEAFDQLYAERQAALQQQRRSEPLLPFWTVQDRHPDRRAVGRLLDRCRVPHTKQTTWGTVAEVRQNFTAHVAGFSPHGNGLDCHRTFEMLWFGMIPVVKSSSLDVLYRDRLPVVVLEHWRDLCWGSIVPRIEQVKYLWPPADEVFTMQYWLAP